MGHRKVVLTGTSHRLTSRQKFFVSPAGKKSLAPLPGPASRRAANATCAPRHLPFSAHVESGYVEQHRQCACWVRAHNLGDGDTGLAYQPPHRHAAGRWERDERMSDGGIRSTLPVPHFGAAARGPRRLCVPTLVYLKYKAPATVMVTQQGCAVLISYLHYGERPHLHARVIFNHIYVLLIIIADVQKRGGK